jgi:hypothetical protein
MDIIKKQLRKSIDRIGENLDKIMSVGQFVIGCIMFACVLTGVVAHSIMGNITSPVGYIVAFVFVYLVWQMLRISYKEMSDEFKK